MWKLALGLTLATLAACGSQAADEIVEGYSVGGDDFGFVHEVGDTDCPQDLGDLEVTNDSDFDLGILVSVDDVAGLDLIDFGDEDDLSPTELDEVILDLLPGETGVVAVWFNCGQAASFSTDIVLTPDDEELEELFVPIDGDVE
jgi:hypothetical protein